MRYNYKSSFEDLANEIFYEIIEYLDFYHVYKAFFNLNQRYQCILTNSIYPIRINILAMSKSNFEHYYNDIIIPNKHRINKIRLSNLFTINIIFSSSRFICKYLQLETLILDNIKSKSLENILNHLSFLPKLNSLTIHPIDYIQNPTIFYLKLFRLPKLKFCRISYETKQDNKEHLMISSNYFSSIEPLIINARFPIDELDNLLSYVPRLHRLTINSLKEFDRKQKNLCSITLKHLKYLSIKIDSIRFKKLEILFKYFFQHIQILRISTNSNIEFLDAKQWEQLILTYMPNLQTFDFYHDGLFCIMCIRNPLKFHETISQFNSSFWTERKWFFTHQHTSHKTLDCGIFYSIEPYSKQITNNCLNYFPNATEVTFKYSFNAFENSISMALNHILPLIKLTKLTIEYCSFPFEQLLQLLSFTPNLNILKFQSISFNQSNFMLIQQNETFIYVSKMNQVKSLDVRESCTLECVEMIMNLFPQIEYIKTGLNKKEIEPIGRFLFSKINKKISKLLFLCISYTPKIYLKKLKTFIKLENLLDDYFIDLVDYNLCIWR
ncbi:unnamed protein product [Rotaria sp. Silwood1]|nr:unnamed protein product [Rotaria sp. Silwood1]CAF1644876.1 unnamed protein product [Rotaria sp. Silwood1]CAF3803922.1 unnamed protein product [Rotaria sp. Silwood1]CAF4861411.1 unnamed protein product [Rotaria sp. Silwood1]CAF4936699.1 unnamed protein product [Rotaria sp. Silwood1]